MIVRPVQSLFLVTLVLGSIAAASAASSINAQITVYFLSVTTDSGCTASPSGNYLGPFQEGTYISVTWAPKPNYYMWQVHFVDLLNSSNSLYLNPNTYNYWFKINSNVTISITTGTTTKTSMPSISNITALLNKVAWNDTIEDIYVGTTFGKTTTPQLISAYNALTDCSEIFEWSEILEHQFNYQNETLIKSALSETQFLSNGLPVTETGGGVYSPCTGPSFLMHDRQYLIGFYWAIRYNYSLSTWNLTKAYNSLHALINRNDPHYNGYACPLLEIDNNNHIYDSGRYYDEYAETMDTLLRFYIYGNISEALNDSLALWTSVNANCFITEYNYYWYEYTNYYGGLYGLFECEAGNFLEIAERQMLLNNGSLPMFNNLQVDFHSRFLAEEWQSPQWEQGVLCHAAGPTGYDTGNYVNSQERLPETCASWAAILGLYGSMSPEDQQHVQNMLLSPAFAKLYGSALYNASSGLFAGFSNTRDSNYWTALATNLVFMLSIVPINASLAMPITESHYDDPYGIVNPNLFSISTQACTVNITLLSSGAVTFLFGNQVTYNFASSGAYQIIFSPDWNSISSVTHLGAAPSNNYFSVPQSSNSKPTKIMLALVVDYNHDGQVNFRDLADFVNAYIEYYTAAAFNSAADINLDGRTNFNDLSLFVQDYIAYFGST